MDFVLEHINRPYIVSNYSDFCALDPMLNDFSL